MLQHECGESVVAIPTEVITAHVHAQNEWAAIAIGHQGAAGVSGLGARRIGNQPDALGALTLSLTDFALSHEDAILVDTIDLTAKCRACRAQNIYTYIYIYIYIYICIERGRNET